MLKSELIDTLSAEHPHLSRSDVQRAVNAVLSAVQMGYAQGRRTELRGFGSFNPVLRAPHVGRDPRTGEAVQIPERIKVAFRAGGPLLARLNGAGQRVG